MNNKVLAAVTILFIFGNILSGCTKTPTKVDIDESDPDINIQFESGLEER